MECQGEDAPYQRRRVALQTAGGDHVHAADISGACRLVISHRVKCQVGGLGCGAIGPPDPAGAETREKPFVFSVYFALTFSSPPARVG